MGQCAQRPQVARSKPGQCFNPCVFQTRATLRQSINSPDICCPPRSTFVQSARLLSAFSAAILNRDLIPPPLREKLISIRVKIFVTKLFYHFYCEKYDVNFSVKKFSYSRIFRILFNKTLLHLIEKSFEIRFDEICSKDHESEKRD